MDRQTGDYPPHAVHRVGDTDDAAQLCARPDPHAERADRFVVCTTFRHGEEPPFNLVDDFDADTLTAAIAEWQHSGYSIDIEYLYDC